MSDPAAPLADAVHALHEAVAALEAQRAALGDAVADAALAPLRQRLHALQGTLHAAQQHAQQHARQPAATPAETAAAPPADQQLRQVSVLFVDVTGSTALSRHLDPEELYQLMDGSLRRYTAVVQRHGGTVLQYAGDSLLAAFGTPPAHEDDPERAVQAALAVLDEARAQAAEVRARHGHDGYGVRAGIATGPVLLGGGVEGQGTIRGMVVNVAARMEQTAPPGRLRICPDTERLVRGLFELEAQPPLAVKGVEAPMVTWLVQRRRDDAPTQATRGVGGVHSPLIGRDAELAALQQAWSAQHAAAGADCHVTVVMGEAGIGKTRLAHEFRAWARAQAPQSRWLEAQASERASGQPYGVLRQLFTRHLGILDSHTAAEAGQLWLRAMRGVLADEADAAVLGQLLGMDFADHAAVRPLLADGQGRQLRDRAFFHAMQALQAIAGVGGTLTAFIDDLQWADAGTLDFIDHALGRDPRLMMLLCSSRPALDERHAGWASKPGRQCLTLAPLAGGDARALAQALLSRLGEVPQALRDRLIHDSEGNPFYMEELVNMLIDRGAIAVEGPAWRLTGAPLDDASMPSTLTGVVQARLDELAPQEAQLLQWAAVVGPVFWQEALHALGPVDAAGLQLLVQRQFIEARRHSMLAGQREYAFRHHVLHQVCYERVLKRVKVPAHARVAAWLAAQPGQPRHDLIAQHHERGGEPLLAARAWRRGAEDANRRSAFATGAEQAQRALTLTPADDLRARCELHLLREESLGQLAERDLQRQELDQLDALVAVLADPGLRAEAAIRRGWYAFRIGQTGQALAIAELLVREALPGMPADDPRGPRIVHLRAAALAHLGRMREAREQVDAILQRSGPGSEPIQVHNGLLNELGMMALSQGDVDMAAAWFRQALAAERARSHVSNEAGVLCNLGYLDLSTGGYDAARSALEQARSLFRKIGQPDREGIVLVNLGIVSLRGGDPSEAAVHAREGRGLLARTRSRWAEAAALRVLGQALLAQGDAAGAAAVLADAGGMFTSLGYALLAAETQASRAAAALALGDHAAACGHCDAVLAAWTDENALDGMEEPLRAVADCWQVLQQLGDPRAVDTLRRGRAMLARRARRISDRSLRRRYVRAVPQHLVLRRGVQAPAAAATARGTLAAR